MHICIWGFLVELVGSCSFSYQNDNKTQNFLKNQKEQHNWSLVRHSHRIFQLCFTTVSGACDKVLVKEVLQGWPLWEKVEAALYDSSSWLHNRLQSVEEPMLEREKSVKRRRGKPELVWTHNTPSANHSSHLHHCWVVAKRSQEKRSEVESGEAGSGKKCCFNFCLCFLLPESILLGSKLIFPRLSLFCPWWSIVSNLPIFILTHEVFFLFSTSVLLRGASESKARWASDWRFC